MRFKKMGILFITGTVLTLTGCSAMNGTLRETSVNIQMAGLDKLEEIQVKGHLYQEYCKVGRTK